MKNDGYQKKRVRQIGQMLLLALVLLLLIQIVMSCILLVKHAGLKRSLNRLEKKVSQVEDFRKELEQREAVRQMVQADSLDLSDNVRAQDDAGSTAHEPAHKVYLTFDDGPSACTSDILDILKQYNVKATFFVIGQEGQQSEELLHRIVAEGHSLALHSYTHRYDEIYASKEAFISDFEKIQNYVYAITGVKSTLYRFPGGSSNSVSQTPMEELATYLDAQGVTYFDWNVDSGDAKSRQYTVDDVVSNCMKDVVRQNSSVILMHDAAEKRTTVEALPLLIETLSEMDDLVFLPITEETAPVQHKVFHIN